MCVNKQQNHGIRWIFANTKKIRPLKTMGKSFTIIIIIIITTTTTTIATPPIFKNLNEKLFIINQRSSISHIVY